MKKCVICTGEFTPRKMGQKTCSPICESERKRQAKILKARKDSLKTRRDWLKEAQIEFNKYIRTRDRISGLPCISCGRHHTGDYHAGHYRSVGAAPQLRFNENNVHLQCAPCNTYLSGNAIEYRIRLVERIGIDAVQALEAENGSVKWTIEMAQEIKERYRQKTKELLAKRASIP